VDGARPEAFRELFARGELPAIQRYLTSVSGEKKALTAYPSVTGPTFAPMLTGCFPGTCNLPGVRWFDRSLPKSRRYNYKRFRNYYGKGVYMMDSDLSPKVKTIFEIVPRSYNVLGVLKRGTKVKRDLAFFWAPYLYLQSKREGGLMRVEQGSYRLFLKALEKDPEFLFYYHPSIDAISHRMGVDHPDVRAAYRRLDAIFESMVGMLHYYGIFEETQIILTSDHGMTDVRQHFDLDRFLSETGLDVRYLPKGFKGWHEAAAISMPSGNSMSNIYFRSGSDWRRFTPFEEIEAQRKTFLETLIDRPEVLLIAGRSAAGGVKVWTKKGKARVSGEVSGRMTYETIGSDPFGYIGFPTSFTAAECLQKTHETIFPDAPVELLQFFQSSRAGDLLVAAAEGYDLRNGAYEHPEHRATHGSFFPNHMWIPFFSNRPLPTGPTRSVEIFKTISDHLEVDYPHEVDIF
jgi:hypothetical protein